MDAIKLVFAVIVGIISGVIGCLWFEKNQREACEKAIEAYKAAMAQKEKPVEPAKVVQI